MSTAVLSGETTSSNVRGMVKPRIFSMVLLPCSDCGGESGCWVTLADELCNSCVSAGQSFFIGQEYDAEVLRAGLLSEARAVHDHDVLLADEILYEDFVALWNVDARKSIERATRRNATYAWR